MQDNEFRGYCADVIKEIARIANFNYSLYIAEDGHHGVINPMIGPVNGMLRDLVKVVN